MSKTRFCMLLVNTLLQLIPLAIATERPIIGILTEEVNQKTYPGYSSYIAASYVKAVEQSGARVAPIFINRTEDYYKEVLNSVNGVLFPGGGLLFTNVGGYADAGRIIVKHAKQINSVEKRHFPVLGVCLGFELLFYLNVNSYDILAQCNATDITLPIRFTKTFRNSQLYGEAPQTIIDILHKHSVTYNHHSKCITQELVDQFNLGQKWHILSTSLDSNGTEFVSSAEYYKHPIAGVIFHPEKVAYEWDSKLNISHSQNALIASRHFYDWLVKEAKKNNHTYKSTEEEYSALIYNYYPTYVSGYYEQVYLFK